jgi:hypothetical protein
MIGYQASSSGADFAAIDNFDWSIAWGHQFLVGDDAEAVGRWWLPSLQR